MQSKHSRAYALAMTFGLTPSTAEPRSGGPLVGVASALAAASAAGLGVAHFVVGCRRIPPRVDWRFGVRVVAPAAAALCPAAAAAHLAAAPDRTAPLRRRGLILGAVMMTGLAGVCGVAAARRRQLDLFTTPAGPGLWSLVGAPAFLVLACSITGSVEQEETGDAPGS